MKILVVSSYLPYPLFSGGHIRLYNLLKVLAKKHTITLVCEKRPSQTNEDIASVEQIGLKVITVPRKKQWSAQTIMKTAFSQQSFLINGHASDEMMQAIQTILMTEKVDLIHAETSYIMQNIPSTSIPILLIEHNIEYLVYQRYVDQAPKYMRPLLQLDVNKLRTFEEISWKRAKRVATVSTQEQAIIRKVISQVGLIPNGVDIDYFTQKSIGDFQKKQEKRILYIGDFKWIQNKDAAKWILKEIWPRISKELAPKYALKLWIVGKHIPDDIKQLGDSNVIFDENALDTKKVFHSAFALLAAIRIGGGTSYKILESMACGTPVISTSLGLEGIVAEDKKELLVADTPDQSVTSLHELLQNHELLKKLVKNARRKIETYYSWDRIGVDLEKEYIDTAKL